MLLKAKENSDDCQNVASIRPWRCSGLSGTIRLVKDCTLQMLELRSGNLERPSQHLKLINVLFPIFNYPISCSPDPWWFFSLIIWMGPSRPVHWALASCDPVAVPSAVSETPQAWSTGVLLSGLFKSLCLPIFFLLLTCFESQTLICCLLHPRCRNDGN